MFVACRTTYNCDFVACNEEIAENNQPELCECGERLPRLTLFHVSPGIVTEWTDFPRVRQALALRPFAIAVLCVHRTWQLEERLAAGADWENHGLDSRRHGRGRAGVSVR